MQTINLHIEQDLLSQAIQHFKQFLLEHQTKGNISYIDSFGDTIEIINGVEYVVATKDDIEAISNQESRTEFTSLEDLKKELCIK